MVAAINADLSIIPDEAEVWLISKADAEALGGIDVIRPEEIDDDLDALGWGFVGLVDAGKGIAIEPSGELTEFDAFGYASYRQKFTKGKVKSGFTALEDNAVTAGIVLPGSAAGKVGVPKNLSYYVAYRVVDEGYTETLFVSTRPAVLELTGHSGYVEGAQTSFEFQVHHSPDAKKDVFDKLQAKAGDDTGSTGDDGEQGAP